MSDSASICDWVVVWNTSPDAPTASNATSASQYHSARATQMSEPPSAAPETAIVRHGECAAHRVQDDGAECHRVSVPSHRPALARLRVVSQDLQSRRQFWGWSRLAEQSHREERFSKCIPTPGL